MNPSVNGNDTQGEGVRKLALINQQRGVDHVSGVNAVAPQNFSALQSEIKQAQAATTAPPIKLARRLLFVWLRIYVHEVKRGKQERVNIAIPIPIPLIGALFRHGLDWNQALKAVTLAHDPDGDARLAQFIESCMGLELIRVEEDSPERGKKQLVVIGLD